MKSIAKLSYLFAILGMLLFNACQKEELSTSLKSNQQVTGPAVIQASASASSASPLSSDPLPCMGFSNSELRSIGCMHNKIVNCLFNNVDFANCTDCQDEIVEAMSSIDVDFSNYGFDLNTIIDASLNVHSIISEIGYDARNWNNHPFSTNVYAYLVTIMEEVDTYETVSDFKTAMNAVYNDVKNDANLSCAEKEGLAGTISVAKNSAELWSTAEMGGLDYISGIFDIRDGNTNYSFPTLPSWTCSCPTSSNSSAENCFCVTTGFNGALSRNGDDENEDCKWSIRDAVKSDIVASTAFWGTWGIVLAGSTAVPPANAILLAGWGISSAISSALGGTRNNPPTELVPVDNG